MHVTTTADSLQFLGGVYFNALNETFNPGDRRRRGSNCVRIDRKRNTKIFLIILQLGSSTLLSGLRTSSRRPPPSVVSAQVAQQRAGCLHGNADVSADSDQRWDGRRPCLVGSFRPSTPGRDGWAFVPRRPLPGRCRSSGDYSIAMPTTKIVAHRPAARPRLPRPS